MQRQVLEMEEIPALLSRYAGKKPLEIEVGCGNGHFLTEYGARRKDLLLLGVDRKNRRCQKSMKKVNHRSLENVHILYGRAEALTRSLPDSSVRAYHIYFPDPWPKTKHRRRRFFRMEQLEVLHRTLEPEGRIFFCTDFFDYYLQAKILLLVHGGFQTQVDPPAGEVTQSLFSRRFQEQGKPVYCAAGSKTRR